jgi:predicted small lipoprotein YifL
MITRTRATVAFALLALIALAACATETPTQLPEETEITVTLSAVADTLLIGGELQVLATVLPATVSQQVVWSISSPTTATIDVNGLVTGVTPGTVTVTATSAADPLVSGTLGLGINDCPDPRLVTANVNADETWENWLDTPLCFDYVVTRSTTVSTALLTIEPGVIAGFEEGRLLITSSAGLNATGTEDDPIRLTGFVPTRGLWDGVMLQDTQHPSNRIERTTIEYGGGTAFGGGVQPANLMLVTRAEVPLVEVTLRESAGYGVYLTLDIDVPAGFDGGAITANAMGAVHAHARTVDLLSAGATLPDIGNNDRDLIDVVAFSVPGDGTWANFTAPYNVLESANKLNIQGDLTIAAGTIVLFEQDQAMSVTAGGSLQAVGTAALPIVLTGAVPVRGSWRGLQISDTNTTLDYVEISFGGGPGGSGSFQPANLQLTTGATGPTTNLVMRNTILRESAGYGLFTRPSEVDIAEFAANTLVANSLGPAYIAATHVKQMFDDSAFLGNGLDRILVQVQSAPLELDDVTWRDVGVPYQVIGGGEATPTFLIENASFTIEPGVEMFIASNLGFNVRASSLNIIGTQLNPIRMAGDGLSWRGVQLFESAGSFDFVDFVDAGSSSWGGVNEPASVSITAATGASAATFSPDVTSSGAVYALAFGFGSTTAQGCIAPFYIPPPDIVADHCK